MPSTRLVSLLLAASAVHTAAGTSVSCTPHDSYSSSVGVLGCKINTNRVAYWPGSVDCTNICVKLTYSGRSVHLLRIDQSGGAHDISYDAWNYLQTGESATSSPISGGGVDMEYEDVDASECASLIYTDGGKLPLSASNSMGFVASCLADSSSWVAQNHVLYNIADPLCSLGFDEPCSLDLAISNQPSCHHTLGLTTPLATAHVYNIEYPSGKCVDSSSGDEVSASVALAASGGEESASGNTTSTESTPSTAAPPSPVPTTPTSASTTAPPPAPLTTTSISGPAVETPVSPGIFVTSNAAAAAAASTQPTMSTTPSTSTAVSSTTFSTSTTPSAASSTTPGTMTSATTSTAAARSSTKSSSSSSTTPTRSATTFTFVIVSSTGTTSSTKSSSSTSTGATGTTTPPTGHTSTSMPSSSTTAVSGTTPLSRPGMLVFGAWAIAWALL